MNASSGDRVLVVEAPDGRDMLQLGLEMAGYKESPELSPPTFVPGASDEQHEVLFWWPAMSDRSP